MAETEPSKAEAVAEKAYAAAAEALPVAVNATPETAPVVDAVAFPPKAKRGRKPRASEAAPAEPVEVKATEAEAKPDDVATAPVVAAVQAKPAPAKPRKPVRAVKAAKPAAKRVVAKPVAAKVVAPVAVKRPAPRKAPIAPAPVSHTKAAPKPAQPAVSNPLFSQIKDHTMTDVTSAFTDTVKGAFTEVQSKAKTAFEKGSAAFAGYNEFAKGNVEAVVESGKILAAGLQDLSTNIAAESRSAFETATSDVKELAAAKSPADFFKLQSDLFRRNFDAAVAYNSKASEAVLKLTNEVFAPISGRVSLAVEKVRSVA
jgi:phasin family protein